MGPNSGVLTSAEMDINYPMKGKSTSRLIVPLLIGHFEIGQLSKQEAKS